MSAWSEFVPLVQVHLTGAAQPVMIDMIRRSAIKFCQSTRAYRADLDLFSAREGRRTYEVETPPGTELIVPLEVEFDEVPLAPITEGGLPARWRHADNGTPRYYFFLNPGEITFYPTPSEDQSQAIFIRAALKPSLIASSFPTALFKEHASTIAYGALRDLMMMPGKPWENPGMAKYFDSLYEADVADVRIKLNKASTTTELSIGIVPLV